MVMPVRNWNSQDMKIDPISPERAGAGMSSTQAAAELGAAQHILPIGNIAAHIADHVARIA
jgi:hypothetical protein